MEAIYVYIKQVYGEDKVYPACEKCKLLCQLAGTKTITDQMLGIINKLGYQVFETLTPERKEKYLKERAIIQARTTQPTNAAPHITENCGYIDLDPIRNK